MKEIRIEKKDSGQRCDKYLLRIMPSMGKSFLYKMLRKKNIVLNSKKLQGNEILNEGDVLKIFFSDETIEKFMSVKEDIDTNIYEQAYNTLKNIKILYEDDNFIILSKPIGVLSQKASDNDLSLNEWLIGYLLFTNAITKESLTKVKPSICNRLDRNTSGIVLAAKTTYGSNIFNKIIKERTLQKLYLAKVLGKLEGNKLLIGYHIKNEEDNVVNIINESNYQQLSEEDKSKYIKVQTKYNSLSASYTDEIDDYVTLVELDLITGKSHQIRAHMAIIGHALIGDNKYGSKVVNKTLGYKYQLLHAYKVVFPNNDELLNLSGKVIQCNPGWINNADI